MLARPVAFRYRFMAGEYGNTEVVAPISAPMLQIVPMPVAERVLHPSPKYSTMAPVPPATVVMPASLRMTSLGATHGFSLPFRCTPITLGHLSSHGIPAMTSTASAPPTPMAIMPRPPPFTVCESVPMSSPPGNA
eukprot:Amastigsp_a512855_9.p4 type:complete len:135 gc:universal Amastigsp_a512855_9:955-551(-)